MTETRFKRFVILDCENSKCPHCVITRTYSYCRLKEIHLIDGECENERQRQIDSLKSEDKC